MLTDALWIKRVRACHRQQFRVLNKRWFSIVELDKTTLHDLFPLRAHRLIQNSGVDESHLWAGMRHPLLNHPQTHPVVEQFNCFRMSECVQLEMKYISRLISNLILSRKALQGPRNVPINKGISVEETLGVMTSLVFGSGKKPLLGIFFRQVMVFDPLNLCENNSSHFRGDGNAVSQDSRFLDIPNQTVFAAILFQARIPFEIQDI